MSAPQGLPLLTHHVPQTKHYYLSQDAKRMLDAMDGAAMTSGRNGMAGSEGEGGRPAVEKNDG